MNKTMKTLLVGGLIGLTGCATMKSENVDIMITPSSEVLISNVSVHKHGEEVHVTGTLRPTSATTSRTGHVDIEFLNADGTVIKTVQAVPNVALFMRNSRQPKSFSVKGEVDGLAEVRLVHHPDTMNECEL
ncbi:hypothetical protein P4C99_04165 [Pontiellaceae bacterium B1224]|nr:hypothetical protein [Pontiellaceae bacterium B1224]